MTTPKQGNRIPDGVPYIADNGCFGKGYPGDEEWAKWLASKKRDSCLLATAPDVVGDAEATLARSEKWLGYIRSVGFPAGLVAQDGLSSEFVPWSDIDALFIGGTTEWKLGDGAASLVGEAKGRGKWVHMGRVNSRLRFRYAQEIGCDSVDGTFLVFGPTVNLPKLLSWSES